MGDIVHLKGYKDASGVYTAGKKVDVQGYSPYGGTLYMAGTKTKKIGTEHKSGTYYRGDGPSDYFRGTAESITKQGEVIPYTLYVLTGGRYLPLGKTGYYAGSGPTTYYKGNGAYVTGRGTSVDAIGYSGTLYEAGAEITPTSTSITGLYKRDDEENWSYTPIGPAATGVYQRDEEEDRVINEAGKPLTHNLATVTTREVTALTV